jgi:hypothetical protein
VEGYALAQEGKAARPYIWRLIIVIMLALPFHGGGAAGQGQPGGNGLLVAHNCIQIITFCMRHAGGRRFEPGEPNGGYSRVRHRDRRSRSAIGLGGAQMPQAAAADARTVA